MFIKVCGITQTVDARYAAEQGATAVGVVFWPESPRYVDPARAAAIVEGLPATVETVGVFVNAAADDIRGVLASTGIRRVQLHGDEPPALARALGVDVLRSVTAETAEEVYGGWPPGTLFLLDAADRIRRGGTGQTVDWDRAAAVARAHRVVLAGGLTPDNVADAIRRVRPFGVDVSSGVERAPGVKDFDKVARFVARARSAFDER
jgi:phosphoribosylanthranilate isomerase